MCGGRSESLCGTSAKLLKPEKLSSLLGLVSSYQRCWGGGSPSTSKRKEVKHRKRRLTLGRTGLCSSVSDSVPAVRGSCLYRNRCWGLQFSAQWMLCRGIFMTACILQKLCACDSKINKNMWCQICKAFALPLLTMWPGLLTQHCGYMHVSHRPASWLSTLKASWRANKAFWSVQCKWVGNTWIQFP